MKPLLVIGASSFGQLVSVLAEECGRTVAGFVDDTANGPDIFAGTSDLGKKFEPGSHDLVMAIGYKHLRARLELFEKLRSSGFAFPPLIHPRARISNHARIGAGCLVMAGADVDAFTEIGNACVLWPNATVSHDNRIGENTFISPSATLCGFVTVGHSTFIGANCTIIDGSTVPQNGFIKASTRYYNCKQAP